MMKALSIVLALFVAFAVAGCNQSSAIWGAGGKPITITVKEKKRDWLADEETHMEWVVKTTQGDTFAAYYGNTEFDLMNRSGQWKDLKEGKTYSCEVYGRETKALHHWRVLKNCEETND